MTGLRLTALLAVACTVGACATGRAVPRPFPGASVPPVAERPAAPGAELVPAPASEAAGAVLATALAFRGVPYRNGGSDPSGFDCSGLVQFVFAQHGHRLPREVRDQFRVGEPVDTADVRAGDLLFFETVSRGASHVAIALGGGSFVHAPSSRGVVRVEQLSVDYWSRRFIGAKRILAPVATGSN